MYGVHCGDLPGMLTLMISVNFTWTAVQTITKPSFVPILLFKIAIFKEKEIRLIKLIFEALKEIDAFFSS